MYETAYLPDAVVLLAHKRRLVDLRVNGSGFATFTFDLTEPAALEILNSPNAHLCRTFHKSWRELRRRIDSAQTAARITARTTAVSTAKEE